jgi:hypothetical protein
MVLSLLPMTALADTPTVTSETSDTPAEPTSTPTPTETPTPAAEPSTEPSPAVSETAENNAAVVAQIGTGDDAHTYTTLQAAIDAVQKDEIITLLADETPTETVVIPTPTNQNSTFHIKIESTKEFTLDLNGNTLTAKIYLAGKMTVKDTKGNGKITSADIPLNIDGVGATLTLDSGTIESTKNYGVFCFGGAKAIVNGGTVHAYYAALAGNNVAGDMNFEVNGGVLTADCGAAIFMPGQIKLEINGGVMNGGILLRMGQVTIKGGTINAPTNSIDDIKVEYKTSNMWLADAIYVLGHSYESKNTTYGNSLNLTIEGGEINCTNGQGSAVAVYDLGKDVSQKINVNIKGGTLNTNSNVGVYRTLTLEEAGVTSPASGYGVKYNADEITTIITGGTYSTPPADSYLAAGYTATESNGSYTVARRDDMKVEVTDKDGNVIGAYATLQAAINGAKAGDTVTLLGDVSEGVLNTSNPTINKNITLDLNQHTLTGLNQCAIVVNGATATIKNGTLTGGSLAPVIVQSNGTLTLDNVTATNNAGIYTLYVLSGSTLNVESGTYDRTNGKGDSVLYCLGTANVDGGTFTGLRGAVVSGTGVINMRGGTLSGAMGACVQLGGTLTVTQGTIQGTVSGIYCYNPSSAYGTTTVTLNGGTVTCTGDGTSGADGIRIQGCTAASNRTKGNIVVTINSGASVSGDKTANVDTTGNHAYCGVVIEGLGAVLNVKGGTVSGRTYAISGNGTKNDTTDCSGTEINIEGGKIQQTGPAGGAIYHPQDGTLNISGDAEISGKSGIQMCSGTGMIVSITGGSVTADGTDLRSSKTGDGFINDGAAISIVNRSYPGGTPRMTITGGTFTSTGTYTENNKEKTCSAVLAYTWSNNTASEWATANKFLSITGGKFSSSPAAYVADQHTVSGPDTDGNYSVVAMSAENSAASITKDGTPTYYATLAAAVDAADNGETVTLHKNVEHPGEMTISGKKITLDLNGHDITLNTGSNTARERFQIKEAGGLTVTGTGTITGGWGTFLITGKATDDATTTTLYVDKGVTVTGGDYPVWVQNNGKASYGVQVDIYGHISGREPIYVSGNIQATSGNVPVIHIYGDATVNCTTEGIYLAGYAKTTFEDGVTVTSNSNDFNIAAGVLTIKGGTYTAAESVGKTESSGGSITTTTCTALYIKQHSTGLPVTVTIEKGDFSGAYALLEEINKDASADKRVPSSISLTVQGGTFTAKATGDDAKGALSIESVGVNVSVTGGTFSSSPAAYVASGYYVAGSEGGTYQVQQKTAPTVTAPEANTLTYTGEAQDLVTGGSATGGTVEYSQTENGTYSTTIPTGTDAGTYTVWYKVVGDASHIDSAPTSVAVTIDKATPTVTITPSSTSLSGGGRVTLTVTATDGAGEITVTSTGGVTPTGEGSTWTVTLPNSTASYTFTAASAESDNYLAGSANCTVSVSAYVEPVVTTPTTTTTTPTTTTTGADGSTTTSSTSTTTDRTTGAVTETTTSTTTAADGATTESKVETTTARDGTVTETATNTTTAADGSTTESEVKTVTATDGTVTETTASKTTAADGSTTESTSETVTAADGTVTETTAEKTTAADGSTTESSSATVTATDGTVTETTAEKTTAADGSTTESKSETVTAADGAKTETKSESVVAADGATKETTTESKTTAEGVTTSTETVKAATADGTTAQKVTTVDETGASVTVAEAAISAQAVAAAVESGEAVTLPVTVAATKVDSEEAAPVVSLSIPENVDSVKVEIPMENVTPGTVVVLVHEDGTEEIVKLSAVTDAGLALNISGDVTVKLVDNTKSFDDVSDSWAGDAIDFATSRELFNGQGNGTFAPEGDMTRSMLVTVLARLDGVDTTTGATWDEAGLNWAKENGISDGTNGDSSITREMLATMLYRYMGTPVTDAAASAFPDADQVNSYAADAMNWAVSAGIIGGTGDGTLNPSGLASRAEVATMLQRFTTTLVK